MNDTAAITSQPTKSYSPTSSDDLLPPINLTNRQQASDSTGWSESDVARENWRRSTPDDTVSFSAAVRRPPSASLQKLSFPPNMSSFSKEKAATAVDPSSHWRFNSNGQLVNSDAGAYDLANEIVHLKISDVGGDSGDNASIRTPPQSKGAAAAVAHLAEASPLETASSASADSSPHGSDQIGLSHSREPSADSTLSSTKGSVRGSAMLANSSLKAGGSEIKERPHSYSGGLSAADLRRLQTAGDLSGPDASEGQPWTPTQHRNSTDSDQLSYPSLTNNTPTSQRPPAGQVQLYDYRTNSMQNVAPNRDELQIDYSAQQRNFNPLPQPTAMGGPASPPFVAAGRPGNIQTRPGPRGFPQQNFMPSATPMGYGPGPQHANHLSMGNSQQVYDMMLPGPAESHPAVNRIQQQHNLYRGSHQHSTSDPSNIRDPNTMGLLNNNMQGFAPGMFPAALAAPTPMPMYPNQFYGGQDAYVRPDPVQAMAAARLQQQFTGPYGMVAQPVESALASPTSTHGSQNGPSANNRKLGLYKTELCRSWEEKGSCRYGAKCQFAHGEEELRKVSRHPKYKTEICRTFWVSGSCPYGKRCCFIHTELPAPGAPPGSTPSEPSQPPSQDGRARSMSTNSDPNEGGVSLLARISAKRTQDTGTNGTSTPVDGNAYQFSRPPTGALRVDTSSLDASATMGKNKSAYPSFASNGVLMPAQEPQAKSPGPVTAGPDLGRHNSSRLEIVGYNQRLSNSGTPPSSHNPRHSFGGSEDMNANFNNSPPVGGHSYTLSSGDANAAVNPPGRVSGHVRAGSAGNWGNLGRQNYNFGPASAYPTQDGGNMTSPWSTTELAVGSSRLNEKAWA